MADKTQITNPIEIKDNSVERVAFDLMEKIAFLESRTQNSGFGDPNPREYYLKLYNQCHRTVYSHSAQIKVILEDDFS